MVTCCWKQKDSGIPTVAAFGVDDTLVAAGNVVQAGKCALVPGCMASAVAPALAGESDTAHAAVAP
jgi:hypothetical protein